MNMPVYFADCNFNIAADHFSYFGDSAYSESAASCQAFFRDVVDVANLRCAMRADETVKHCLQQPKVLFNDPSGDPRLEKRPILMVSSHLQEDHPLYLPVRIQPRNNDHAPKYIPDNERFSIQSILGLEQSTSQNTLVANPQLDSEQLQRDTSPAENELDDKAPASGSDESLTSSHEDHCESGEWKADRKAYEQSERRKAYLKAYEQTEKRKAYRKAYRQRERVKAAQRAYQKVYQKYYRQTQKGRAYQKAYRESSQGRACLKAYRKAYHKVLRVTGEIEQARIAGRQATAFIREANKANNNEPLREQTGS